MELHLRQVQDYYAQRRATSKAIDKLKTSRPPALTYDVPASECDTYITNTYLSK
jgi:hypothetical protein